MGRNWCKVCGRRVGARPASRLCAGCCVEYRWERWKQPDGEWLLSATVITTDPNPLVAPIHDRMPVIVAPADYDRWLSPEPLPPGMLDDILVPAAPDDYEVYPVSALVNSPENDSPQCVVEAQPIQGSLF